MPSTGRLLLRASRRRFRPSVLFQPETNLRLGTVYLRNMYDTYSGGWEQTLASYNAGTSRVQNWMHWAQYREPAEFVENIPFSETRNYVFSVLRNASMYRKLYSPDSGVLAADHLAPPIRTVKVAAASASSKKASFRRSPVVVTKRHHPARRRVRHHSRAKAQKKQ